MDRFLRGQAAARQPGLLPAPLQLLSRIWNWLAGFVQLSEEEQREAGIYFGDQRFE